MILTKFRGPSSHFRVDHFYIVDFHSALTFLEFDSVIFPPTHHDVRFPPGNLTGGNMLGHHHHHVHHHHHHHPHHIMLTTEKPMRGTTRCKGPLFALGSTIVQVVLMQSILNKLLQNLKLMCHPNDYAQSSKCKLILISVLHVYLLSSIK